MKLSDKDALIISGKDLLIITIIFSSIFLAKSIAEAIDRHQVHERK